MSVSAAGPVPLSRVWSGPKVLAEDLTGEDIADVLDLHSGASAWWVLDRTTDHARDELDRLAQVMDLDRLAVNDLTADDHRTKYEQVGQARLVTTNTVEFDRDRLELTLTPISILVTERVLVCLNGASDPLGVARLLTANQDVEAEHGLDGALFVVLKAVVDGYAEAVTWLEAATDELAETLFAEQPMDRTQQLRGFRLRRALTLLRRVTEPMSGLLTDLVEDLPAEAAAGDQRARHRPPRPRVAARHWRHLNEKLDRTAHAADALRDTMASTFETSLALADLQLNTTMKKLTGWAGIVAVPTLVTSFVGMNVPFPLMGTLVGFVTYFAIMVVAGFLLWLLFRRLDWV